MHCPPKKRTPTHTHTKKKIQIAQWLMFFLYKHKDLCSNNYLLCKTSAQCVLETPVLGDRPTTPRNSLLSQFSPTMSSAFSKRLCLKTIKWRHNCEEHLISTSALHICIESKHMHTVSPPMNWKNVNEREDVIEYLQRTSYWNSCYCGTWISVIIIQVFL